MVRGFFLELRWVFFLGCVYFKMFREVDRNEVVIVR